MSAAAGAPQPPDQPTSGRSGNLPPHRPGGGGNNNASNNNNMWTKDDKTKTCKCEPCGERVRFWSMKCNNCGRHICSDCLDGSSDKTAYMKAVARDHVDQACWCKFRSNMNPTFRSWKPAPPIRAEEEWQAKKSKGFVGIRPTKLYVSKKSIRSEAQGEDADGALESGGDSAAAEPDAEYKGSKITTYTMTSSKTERRSIKRKVYDEDASDQDVDDDTAKVVSPKRLKIEQTSKRSFNGADNKSVRRATTLAFAESEQPSAALSNADHLDGGSTVIVGAGFIGLFIARELALKVKEAGLEHTITVVEIRANHCELASGNCVGLLTTSGVPEQWQQLSDLAVLSWRKIVSSQETSRALGFSRTMSYVVTGSGGEGHEQAPAWFRVQSSQSVLDDDNAIGRINPPKLSAWLYEECEKLDVLFRFNHWPVSPVKSERSDITGVEVQNAKIGGRETLNCTNLVLTAGPFTTTVFRSLYGDGLLELENNAKYCDWFHAPVVTASSKDRSALIVNGIAAESESLEDRVAMVPKLSSNMIEISAVSKSTTNIDMELSDALQPTNGRTRELRRIAAQCLEIEGLDVTDKRQARTQGRSLISTANKDCPILDKVPASGLGMTSSESQDARPTGVWLCYGFGHHGTTLAPGVAKVFRRKMFGEAPGIGDYDFCIPEFVKPTATADSKGKGKAR